MHKEFYWLRQVKKYGLCAFNDAINKRLRLQLCNSPVKNDKEVSNNTCKQWNIEKKLNPDKYVSCNYSTWN